MRTSLDTAPTVYPVTLEDVKSHLRILTSDDNAYLSDLIQVATHKVESDLRRALLTQTWLMYLDDFPSSGEIIYIPYPILQSITHIKYYDTSNEQQTWSSDEYDVDIYSEPARVKEASGYTWPSTYNRMNAIEIKFVCGYGDAATDVPWVVKQAVYMLIGHYYENREATAETAFGRPITTVPMGYTDLIWSERTW